MAERTILTVDFLLISKEKEKEKEKIGVANYGNLTTKYAIDNFSVVYYSISSPLNTT